MASKKEEYEQALAPVKRELKKLVTRTWSNFRTSSSSPSAPVLKEDEEEQQQTQLTFNQQLSPFQYEAIPVNGYTRLLTVMPGQKNEPVEVRLSSVSLDDSFQTYDALSYVWGAPDQPKKIISVNGGSMEIYESLHDILVNLRPSRPGSNPAATSEDGQNPVVLWVDAICINQTDIAERNAQIPNMDSIYRNARRTVIWLGSEGKRTEHAFEMLQRLVQDSKTATSDPSLDGMIDGQATLPSILVQLQKAPRVENNPTKELYVGDQTIWRILSCTWWHRSWTLQEILLSTNITMVMGRYKMDWKDLCLAVDHGLRMRVWPMLEAGIWVNPDLVPYYTIRTLQRRLGLYGSANHGSSHVEHGPQILLNLLEGCRQRESKDPRDKIYAVLGILKNIQRLSSATDAVNQLQIEADYASPVAYVYRMMSQKLILATGSLDVLGISPTSSRRGLPSWVTDWSNSATSMAIPLSRDSLDRPRRTHAARRTLATTARFPEDAVTLVIRGHVVATVTETSMVMPRRDYMVGLGERYYDPELKEAVIARLRDELANNGEEEPSAERMSKLLSKEKWDDLKYCVSAENVQFQAHLEWERFAARRTPTNPCGPETGAGEEGVYWKTLCAGTYAGDDAGAEATAKTAALYRQWSRSLERLRKHERRYGSLGRGLHSFTYTLQQDLWVGGYIEFPLYCECITDRRLGWCDNGWLALLPGGARRGDKVVLAEGGRVPLVLRPDGDGYHTFLGESYVHGIMNGEAFKQSQCEDIKIC